MAEHVRSMTRRHAFRGVVVVTIAVLGAAGAVGASAATLGGLGTADLGAAQGSFASHSSGITATWTARWSGTDMVLDSLTLTAASTEPFVSGETIQATVAGASGAAICALGVVQPAASSTVVFSRTVIESTCGMTPIPYSAIARIALAVTGTTAP